MASRRSTKRSLRSILNMQSFAPEGLEKRWLLTGGSLTYAQTFETVALDTQVQFQNIDSNMNAQPVPFTPDMYSKIETSPVDAAGHGKVMHTHANESSDGRNYMPQLDIHNLGPAGPTGFTSETVDFEFDYLIPATTGAAGYYADGVWFGVRSSADFSMFAENLIKGNGLYVKPPKDTNNGRTGGGVFIGSGIDSWTGVWHHMKATYGPIAGGNITFTVTIDGTYTATAVVAAEAAGNGTPESYWDQIEIAFRDTSGTHDMYWDNFSVKASGGGGSGGISGMVWNDSNSNGTKDGAETGISGWQLYLDTNNNGTKDAGESSTTTDASGNYSFGSLAAGTYHVKQITTTGYRKTKPPQGTAGYDVTVASAVVAGNDFGDTTNIFLGGKVFNDANSNGVQDGAEAGIPNVTVQIISPAGGSVIATRTTAADGSWKVQGLASGSGQAKAIIPGGFTATSPAGGIYTGSASSGERLGNLNFGLHATAFAAPAASVSILDGSDSDLLDGVL